MAQKRLKAGGSVPGPRSAQSRYVLEDAPFGLHPTVLLAKAAGCGAPLHEAGLVILSAAYGRDFRAENDLLPDLPMDMDRLHALCRTGRD